MFKQYKKFVQTVSYAPHFISMVVLVGMLSVFLSPQSGIINIIIRFLGGDSVYFMGRPDLFQPLYVWSGVWQNTGRAAIIYIAALAGISPDLHEAAMVDGATKFQRVIHIDIPGIMPTAVIMLLLNLGQIMNIGFEKAFLMQNNLNIVRSEIISTYVYKLGLLGAQFSFATAVGLFNSVIGFALVIAVNALARKFGDTSLW
jgi:putative aldouronate transport system permease protein